MKTEISSFVTVCFDRELKQASGCGAPLHDDKVASGFVNGFTAVFCIRTWGEIREEEFNSLLARAYSLLGIE